MYPDSRYSPVLIIIILLCRDVCDNGWRRLQDRTMRQVAVGGAGVWGVAKVLQLFRYI